MTLLDFLSEQEKKEVLQAEALNFYTIGYEGHTISSFIGQLKAFNIKTLVDSRASPWSSDEAFRKNNLRLAAEREGIRYVHLPNLGVPGKVRNDTSIDWASWYRDNVVPQINVGEFIQYEKPVAFMCMERNEAYCHRHLIRQKLEKDGFKGKDITK